MTEYFYQIVQFKICNAMKISHQAFDLVVSIIGVVVYGVFKGYMLIVVNQAGRT